MVTGSRIRRDPLDQTSPVITLDDAAIQRTGLTSVADVLQRLPSASGGLNTKVNNSGNLGNPPDGGGVGAGAAEVDLRYLSAKRTLVLVDGLRYVNGTSGSGIPSTVDLNTIPASMIDRVEVLQAGASPLYGSDAIAGVVNVITKQRQEGLRLSGQFGTFRAGDGHTYNIDASYGIQTRNTGTSLVFGASYVNQKAVRSGNRRISQFPNPGQTSCTDPSRQEAMRTHAWKEAEDGFGQSKATSSLGHDDVEREQRLKTAAQGVSLHETDRDDRQAEPEHVPVEDLHARPAVLYKGTPVAVLNVLSEQVEISA